MIENKYILSGVALLFFVGAEVAHRAISISSDQATYAAILALGMRALIYIVIGVLYGRQRVRARFVLGAAVALSAIEYFVIGFVGVAIESVTTTGTLESDVFIGLIFSYPIACIIAIGLISFGYLCWRIYASHFVKRQ